MKDEAITQVYSNLLQKHGCSVDAILEAPELREEFLREARRSVGNLPERDLLHKLVSLRKRSKLPRSRQLA